MESVGYRQAYGSFTDVVTLAQDSGIACCNLSVGYDMEHTKNESLDLDAMYHTMNMLKHSLPNDFWLEVYDAEEDYSFTRWGYGYGLSKGKTVHGHEPVCCDVCESHEPLYDVGWGFVCDACLEYAEM